MKLPRCAAIPILCLSWTLTCSAEGTAIPAGSGLAEAFAGDVGIAKHPSVVFVEDFEADSVDGIKQRWSSISNKSDALGFDAAVVPTGSAGTRSLRITGRKGLNDGGFLYKLLPTGHTQLHARMYVRFDEHYGMNHHFCKLGGDLARPTSMPGRAGTKPTDWFLTGLEPTTGLPHTWPPKGFEPPGYWSFYTYYPDMHSWQTEHGASDGRPKAYYGNRFAPLDPSPIARGTWICVEWAIGLNSTPESSDGWQRFWIDGVLVGDWSPGNPDGYWMRENFRQRPDQPDRQKPFTGFRWRTNPDVLINIFKIENYVPEGSYKQGAEYMAEHPDFKIDPEHSVVWFDHVVLATEYIGPMVPVKAGR